MKLTEKQKQLVEMAAVAERGGEFTIKAMRLEGVLKGGAKACVIVEPVAPEPEKSSFAGCGAVLAVAGFILFVAFMGVVGSQHKAEPQQDQATVQATPTPEATPTPGN